MDPGLQSAIAYIGIGSNLGDRVAYLSNAVNAIKQLGDSIVMSSVYESDPFGVTDEAQPMYLNMVAVIRTELRPGSLLYELLRVEVENGRVRSRRNESRTLDLDILVYGDEVIESCELQIPHPRMHERGFVMIPLAEVAAELEVPMSGRTASEIAGRLLGQGVRRVGMIEELAIDRGLRSLASGPV